MEIVATVLAGFGMSKDEISVYIAALELGSRPASLIAKKAGLKRSHTYNVLSALATRGLVQEFEKGGVKHFTCSPPTSLLSMLSRREEELQRQKSETLEAIPILEKIRNPHFSQPTVRFFKGVESLKEIYEDTVRSAGVPIYAFCDFDTTFPKEQNRGLNDWLFEYASRRAEKEVWYYGIVNKSAETDRAFRLRKKQKRELKMIQNVHLPVEINIYGNKVALMSTSEDMVGLIIEDEPIADTLRNLHQAIWPFLPEYR